MHEPALLRQRDRNVPCDTEDDALSDRRCALGVGARDGGDKLLVTGSVARGKGGAHHDELKPSVFRQARLGPVAFALGLVQLGRQSVKRARLVGIRVRGFIERHEERVGCRDPLL